MAEGDVFEAIRKQSSWYGARARRNRLVYVALKSAQLLFASAIPIVSLAGANDVQRWTSAGLGALIAMLEGVIQLGQYQRNWLEYRATREALKAEELLHSGTAGPYHGIPNPDILFVERCNAIISGENSRWLAVQDQSRQTASGRTSSRTD